MNSTASTLTSLIDPVCGMVVDPAHAAGTSHYDGTTFHFCASSCKESFDAAPERYVSAPAAKTSCCGGGHCSA